MYIQNDSNEGYVTVEFKFHKERCTNVFKLDTTW